MENPPRDYRDAENHWHMDFSCVNIAGTFCYLCSVLDGCSRSILAWDIRPQMKEADAGIVIQRARECFPQARPQIISDNGPQFVTKELLPPPPGCGALRGASGRRSRGFPAPRLREFIRLWQTTHVFCSPHYPQSNGKLEGYHRTLKEQAIRAKTPLTLADARRAAADFIDHYNSTRLHSAIGYIAPQDRLAGRHLDIFAARDKKLETARELRRIKRQQQTALVA